MEPIQGTNVSLAVFLSQLKAVQTKNSVDMASAKLALDVQKTAGQEIVKMLENLGTVIDTYA